MTTVPMWNRKFSIQAPPPPDPRRMNGWKTGSLKNGLRFAVMESPDQPGEVSLRFLVMAGSIHENAGERGLAHFVEHLAFQHPETSNEGSAMDIFQRLGLKPGPDANAHTAADHTLYRLDLPLADDESLETALAFFRHAADGMLFPSADIEKERKVVLRELDERESGHAAALRRATILPGVRAAEQDPGGLIEDVTSATPARLREFWQRNYLSTRMVIVAAGDLNAEEVVGRIEKHFASLPQRKSPPEPVNGDPLAVPTPVLAILPHGGTDKTRITIAGIQPIDSRPDSTTLRRENVMRSVALEMLQHRLGRSFEGAGVMATQPIVSAEVVSPGIGWEEAHSMPETGHELEVLRRLVEETRRVLAHGFEPMEFAEARGEVRRKIRSAFSRRQSQSVADLATSMTDSIRMGRILESPEDELNRSLTDFAELTEIECENLLCADWGHAAPRIVVSRLIPDGFEKQARQTIAAIPATPPLLPKNHTPIQPLVLGPTGAAGVVLEKRLMADGGFLETRFSNGVMARLAPIPSLGGHVEVRVGIGYGNLSMPRDKPALSSAAHILGSWYPLEGWRQLQFRAALADEDVSVNFRCGSDMFLWSGTTSRNMLRRQLEILSACATRPGILDLGRNRRFQESHETHMKLSASLIYPPAHCELTRLTTGHDPRFEPIPEGLADRTGKEVVDWLKPELADGRIGIVITGDFEPLQALDAIASTFGALPARRTWEDPSRFPGVSSHGGGLHQVSAGGKTKIGHAEMIFPFGGPANIEEAMSRRVLAELVQIRMRSVMRESLGESYSPEAGLIMSADRKEQWLIARVPCAAGRENEVGENLRDMVDKLVSNRWSDDEFVRAARPVPFSVRKLLRDPAQLSGLLWNPEQIPSPKPLDDASLNRLRREVGLMARRVLASGNAMELRVLTEE